MLAYSVETARPTIPQLAFEGNALDYASRQMLTLDKISRREEEHEQDRCNVDQDPEPNEQLGSQREFVKASPAGRDQLADVEHIYSAVVSRE